MGALREMMIEEIRLRNFSPRTEPPTFRPMVGLDTYSISFDAQSAGFASVRLSVPQSNCKHAPQLTAPVSIGFHCHPIFTHMPSQEPLRVIECP